jgi:hypothetical protein
MTLQNWIEQTLADARLFEKMASELLNFPCTRDNKDLATKYLMAARTNRDAVTYWHMTH